MKLLLLAATQQEIRPFLQQAHQHIDVVISGVGIAATTYHLTKQLSHHHYDFVLQAGIAGSFTLPPGQVVTVKQDCFGDMGVMETNRFQSIQEMNLSGDLEWIINHHPLLNTLSYQQVKAVTVNMITDNNTITQSLQQKWNADIESMEGAALHYVCRQQQVPYLQLRSISNQIGVRDKSKWLMKEAIQQLNIELEKIIIQILS